MTKSRAEQMEENYVDEVIRQIKTGSDSLSVGEHFVAGMKAMLTEIDELVGSTARELTGTEVCKHLKKFMEQDG